MQTEVEVRHHGHAGVSFRIVTADLATHWMSLRDATMVYAQLCNRLDVHEQMMSGQYQKREEERDALLDRLRTAGVLVPEEDQA